MVKRHKAHFPKRPSTPGPNSSEVGTARQSNDWVRVTLTAELLSDAHFGSGSGGGGIDALVARDRHGRPVIWASHLEGVLRDAARRLRSDESAGDFFGRAGGHRQRALFTSLYTNAYPASHIWRTTAREAFHNRAPKDETLRVVEYVPRGTTLIGHVELPERELPVLRRLTQEVDALGGGRASGAGRVRLSLAKTPSASLRAAVPSTGRLLLLLENRDPLCITATATPDNLIPSLAFVPGRALLGALAAWLIEEQKCDAASLLVSGRISVGDALPLPEAPKTLETIEVLPAPLSLQSETPDGSAGDVPWWAQPSVATRRADAWSATAKQLKRPEADLFVYRSRPSEGWTKFRPARRIRLRNGRSDPKKGDLFATEQIVEDTHFLAELRASPEDMTRLAKDLAPVLDGRRWFPLGRAGAPVEVVKLAWCGEASPAKEIKETATTARLTLTSDLLVRDEHLRWRAAINETTLREVTGATDVHIERSLQDSVSIRGFNGTSRLWRMPAMAIRRGSVFEVSGSGVAALGDMAANGQWLGERTHEGFGRFRLDDVLPGVTSGSPTPRLIPSVADVEEDAVAEMTRAWLTAHSELAKEGRGSDRKPSLSQWFDLVAELEAENAQAIDVRLDPKTAGGRSWAHKDAKAILEDLKKLHRSQQATYAHLFVRWLRASQRAGAA